MRHSQTQTCFREPVQENNRLADITESHHALLICTTHFSSPVCYMLLIFWLKLHHDKEGFLLRRLRLRSHASPSVLPSIPEQKRRCFFGRCLVIDTRALAPTPILLPRGCSNQHHAWHKSLWICIRSSSRPTSI